MAYVLGKSREWKFRKVDSIRLLEGRMGRRRLSLDFVPPLHPALAYDRREREKQEHEKAEGLIMVPIARIEKGALQDFDITAVGGEPLPVLGRTENAELVAAAILYEIGGENAFAAADLVEAVMAVTSGPGQDAMKISEELIERGAYRGRNVVDPHQFTQQAVFLLRRFAVEFLLVALMPAAQCGRRTVVKYSFHWEAQQEKSAGALTLMSAAAGFQTVGLAIELSSADEAASYHLEVHAPDGVLCHGLDLPQAPDASPVEDSTSSAVAHAVGVFPHPPDGDGYLYLGLPHDGMRLMALLVSWFTAAVFWADRAMPGAHRTWLEASGEAVAVLLVLPAAVLALLARPGENYLSRKILFPLRGIVLGCCLLLVGAGAAFIGKLNEPFMSWFWWSGTCLTTVAGLVLVAGYIVGGNGYSDVNRHEGEKAP